MAIEDYQTMSLSNRGEPVPIIHVSHQDDSDSAPAKKTGLREQAGKIKDMFQGDGNSDKFSLQDRLFATLISSVIPTEGMDKAAEEDTAPQGLSKKERKARKGVVVDKSVPAFGPGLMATNFRRFNARVGGLFALQKGAEGLFTWKDPTVTMSFLAAHTFLCLNPHLLLIIPLAIALFLILVPAFLARHPSPANDPRIEPSYEGPPTAPAVILKPAPDLSSDFWHNARDLQNSMEDIAHLFDLINQFVTPVLNFSDEGLSSTLFLGIFVLGGVALMGAQLIPYQLVALVAGWAAFLAGNPQIQKILAASSDPSSSKQTLENFQKALTDWIEHDIILDAPEIRQVEIFELQRYHETDDTWEPWLFSPSPWDPTSYKRTAGYRPTGTQFFEDVYAPAGWIWQEKKWNLDLDSREWVERRMISGVEIEIEGDRWVYDIPPDEVEQLGSVFRARKKKTKTPKSGWEEGTGQEKRGEWRRRRWTRIVNKKTAVNDSRPVE